MCDVGSLVEGDKVSQSIPMSEVTPQGGVRGAGSEWEPFIEMDELFGS